MTQLLMHIYDYEGNDICIFFFTTYLVKVIGIEAALKKYAAMGMWLPLPGPRFNIKMTSYQHRKAHCGDKAILRPCYLHNEIS